MIEPIKGDTLGISVRDKGSLATIVFNKNENENSAGVTVSFKNSTPEFQMKVGALVDEFIYNPNLCNNNLSDFAVDTFERNKE